MPENLLSLITTCQNCPQSKRTELNLQTYSLHLLFTITVTAHSYLLSQHIHTEYRSKCDESGSHRYITLTFRVNPADGDISSCHGTIGRETHAHPSCRHSFNLSAMKANLL